jgi:hypothetical protein
LLVPPTLSCFEGYTDEQQSTEITAPAEVDQTLDELTSRAQASGLPFNVDLDRHDRTHMSIVVGAEETFVEWVQLEPWSSRAAASDRRPDEDDLVSFAGNGQYSGIPRYLWINVELGREAIRHYRQSGTLLATLDWTET